VRQVLHAGIAAVVAALSCPSAVAQDWLYQTREGDNLWDLCIRHTNKQGCWQELGDYNKISNDRAIPIGTTLRIPVAWLINVPSIGRATSVNGDVMYDQRNSGDLVPLTTGQEVHLGSRLVSSGGSAAVVLGNHSQILVRPGASLLLKSLTGPGVVPAEAEIELNTGEIDAKVIPGRESRFEVTTPAAIAAVRGTGFRLGVSDTATSLRGEVLEGEVAIRSQSEQSVPAGFGVIAEAGKPVPKPVELLPPPRYAQLAANLPRSGELAWEPHAEASSWIVDIFTGSGSKQLLSTHPVAEPMIALSLQPAGCYRFSVRAVDSQSLQGLNSETTACTHDPLPAPSGVSAESVGDDQWQVTWNLVEEADSYVVTAVDTTSSEAVLTLTTTDTSLSFEAPEHQSLAISVAAMGDAGISGTASAPVVAEPRSIWPAVLAAAVFLGLLL